MSINTIYFSDRKLSDLSNEEENIGEVCIANISPLERKKRLKFAIQQFTVTLVILGALIALDLNPLWRLPLLFMFLASTTSYFQFLDKT
jgi:hypothetical protein